MTDIDTSAEAVERLARMMEYWEEMAATLRALVRERDKARALIEEMRAPYAIICQREWQAGAEAMREAVRGVVLSRCPSAHAIDRTLTVEAIQHMPIPERPA